MKHLRHPVRAIREPFGKAGLAVAICALVFAMAGGAYAAGGLTKSQEKQVTKIAKKYAGKAGAAGAAGPAGSSGPAGAAGAKGDTGAAGSNGTNGKNGTTGFTETLPSGKTEAGTWATGSAGIESGAFEGELWASISFNIPLSEPVQPHLLTPAEAGTVPACPTPVEPSLEVFEKPEAEPGNLCIYESFAESLKRKGLVLNPETELEVQTGLSGVLIHIPAKVNGFAAGTWAVTAE